MTPNKQLFIHDDLSDFQEKLTKIIHDTLPSEEAEHFEILFKNTINYTSEKLYVLQKELLQQVETREQQSPHWKIFTALTNINKDKDYGNFRAIVPKIKNIDLNNRKNYSTTNQDNFVGVFFCCSYEEFIKITDSNNPKEYKVEIGDNNHLKDFYFRVEKSDIFVREENILFKVAAQYGYNFPPIYSPYSRRFARIIFSDPTVLGNKITKSFF